MNNRPKRYRYGIRAALVAALLASAPGLIRAQEVVEAIVAIVNDDVITMSEYKAEYNGLYEAIRAQVPEEQFSEVWQQRRTALLDQMITSILLLQEARNKGINVAEQLRMTIENIKKENNMENDADLIREIQAQGMDYETWKARLEEDILRQGIIYSEVRASLVFDDSDIVEYYNVHPEEFTDPLEYSLKAVFVAKEGRSAEEAEARKKEIKDKLDAGGEMAAVAAEYSEGPEKESGGDLGSFKTGELAENLESQVKDLEQGQMTDWIDVGTGWYLIQLAERKEPRLQTFEEAREAIQEKLYQNAEQDKMVEYMKTLRETSYIKILIEEPHNAIR
jgi:peptidyl-prolyl cis-trans isomerase SurA